MATAIYFYCLLAIAVFSYGLYGLYTVSEFLYTHMYCLLANYNDTQYIQYYFNKKRTMFVLSVGLQCSFGWIVSSVCFQPFGSE